MPRWWNWKTRLPQEQVPFGAWGFESPFRHHGAPSGEERGLQTLAARLDPSARRQNDTDSD